MEPDAWRHASPRSGCSCASSADEPDEPDIEAMLTADGDQTIVVWEERGMPLELLSAVGHVHPMP
jgi:hypothetical protein